MGILNFINNIRYLFRYNMKQIYKNSANIQYALDHIKYEIEEDLKNIPKIAIKNNDETLDKLVNSNCSIARFGDGEMALMCGENIPSQIADKKLSEMLIQVLQNTPENLMIGIFPIMVSVENMPLQLKQFTRDCMGRYNSVFCKFLKEDSYYYSAGFTFPFIHKGKNAGENEYFREYFDKFKAIWNNKDIVIVCGKRVFNNIKYNIYDNAKSIEYIYGPTNSAFSDYDKILKKILKKDKNKLIILILGATATVMSADLCKRGYRALDLGHLGKDYDAFCKQIESNVQIVSDFFAPE